ncbi:MAG: GerW family sporulation protein [Cellulosilyticum sp.]|nr:GerW family sporulation protein [Cellulosilyticum sp.]
MENKINQDLNGLMSQLENFITTKTVVGEPIHIDQTILVPLIDVSFGAATGSTASNKFVERHKEKEKRVDGGVGAGAGGLGAKVSPSAMLVIQNGTTQLINIRNQDSITKLIDMIPGLISKVPDLFGKNKNEEETIVEETVVEEKNKYHQMKDEK